MYMLYCYQLPIKIRPKNMNYFTTPFIKHVDGSHHFSVTDTVCPIRANPYLSTHSEVSLSCHKVESDRRPLQNKYDSEPLRISALRFSRTRSAAWRFSFLAEQRIKRTRGTVIDPILSPVNVIAPRGRAIRLNGTLGA
jgi:hypothetical protein